MTRTLAFIEPMECLAVTRLPEGPEWGYEVKLDGYRAQVIHADRLRLLSRRGKDLSKQFPTTYRTLGSAIPTGAIIDGELVALDGQGHPDFNLLQNARTNGAPVVFFVFDILSVSGRSVPHLPLRERQQLLRDSLRTSDLVQISESFTIPAARMLEMASQHGLEGILAKRLGSRYEPGRRSGSWQKMRLSLSQEFVVGGFRPGTNGVDSLVLGFYKGRELHYCGRVRAGFIPATRREMYEKLKPLVTNRCPFVNLPETRDGRWGRWLTADRMDEFVWVRPRIVVQCAFLEWTGSDHLRHVRYLGLRQDKSASKVVKEHAGEA